MENRSMARVLLVDDSVPDVKLTRRWLLQCDWVAAVEVVHRGQDAIERIRRVQSEESVDLVLLDVNLSDISGFDVLTEMTDQREFSPAIVMLSGTLSDLIDSRARQLGARLCLAKPWDADEFDKLVRTLGDLWRELQQDPGDGPATC